MIIGKIKADREAVIELEIVSLAQRVKIEAVIDTGFTGFLMLPIDLINRLNLPLIGKRNVLLADGNSVPINLYRVKVNDPTLKGRACAKRPPNVHFTS